MFRRRAGKRRISGQWVMHVSRTNFLITGRPGVGKTTLIRKIAADLSSFQLCGFFTDEIRERGVRTGFELVTLDGRKRLLSHAHAESSFRVGKYRVDIAGFEELLDSIDFLNRATQVIVIDEIGKMECLSDRFKGLLKRLLESEKPVIATIALKGGGIVAEAKARPDTVLFEVTSSNRDSLPREILGGLRQCLRHETGPQKQ
jgi:nucleoside-triphosphatase